MATLIEQLHSTGLIYLVSLAILGLLVGSFLNVVILRMPKKMRHDWTHQCKQLLANEAGDLDASTSTAESPPSIVFPASHCPTCQTPLRWWHNLPVLSYLYLRGRCFACNTPISRRYPFIELLTAGLTVLVGISFPQTVVLPWLLFLTWCLITLSFIDIDHKLLPDNISLPLIWLGLLFNLTANGLTTPQNAILGAVAGYLILWTVYQVHHALTKKEGIGHGDFKLLAASGAWLGWQYLPIILLLSAGAGVLISVSMMRAKNLSKDTQIPFGPYIAAAFFITLLWGDIIQAAYFNLIGLSR